MTRNVDGTTPSEADRVEAVRSILLPLYALPSGFPASGINRIEREAIFFLYENTDHKLSERRPHSLAARQIRDRRKTGLNRVLTYDHAVPLRLLREGLRMAVTSHAALAAFLKTQIKTAVITKEEDKRLAGELKAGLPANTEAFDPMARYRAAGIVFSPEDEHRLRGGIESVPLR